MMIRVYYLPVEKDSVTGTERTKGSAYISHAISETTEEPDVRRIIIEENPHLEKLVLKMEEPTQRDLGNYDSLPELLPPARNLGKEVDDLKDRIEKLEKR